MIDKRVAAGIFVLIAAAGLAWQGGVFSTLSSNGWQTVELHECSQIDSSTLSCSTEEHVDKLGNMEDNMPVTFRHSRVSDTGFNNGFYNVLQNAGYVFNPHDPGDFDGFKEKGTFAGTCSISASGSDNSGDWQADLTFSGQGNLTGFFECKVDEITVDIDCKSSKCRNDGADGTHTMEKGSNVPGLYDPSPYFQVTYNLDDDVDGDGIKNGEDECPREAGIPANNGCPGKSPEIQDVETPENVTANETFTASVTATDSDTPVSELQIEWGNGETGETAEYKFEESGLKQIKVQVSDGSSQVSETVTVEVGEPETTEVVTDSIGMIGSEGLLLLAIVTVVIGGAGAASRL